LTTGTHGSVQNLILSNGSYDYKTWNGTDGKYEVYEGRPRIKFNGYTATIDFRTRLEVRVVFIRKDTPDSTAYIDDRPCGVGGPSPSYLAWPSFLTYSNNDKLAVMAKLIERVKSHDFNLAVNASQGRQLTSMIDLNLRKLTRAMLALKRGDFSTAARQWGATAKKKSSLKVTDISGRWLELQYGWLPSLSDTFEAAKAFEAISEGPRKTTFSARKKREVTGKQGSKQTNDICDWWWDSESDYRIKYELSEEMGPGRQLGLLDPLSVVWENIPYSFVIDWFLPIGTYLSVLAQLPHMKGRFITTEFRKRVGPMFAWSNPKPGFVVGKVRMPELDRGVFCDVTRSYNTELNPPLPNFTDGLSGSPKRIFNAIALAHQAFARRPRWESTSSRGGTSRGRNL
jgi:uncharacterized protein YxjI